MNKIIRFNSANDFLFKTDLQPSSDADKDLRATKSEGEISTALGKFLGAKCTVGIGKPICVPLNAEYDIKGLDLTKNSASLVGELKGYKFFAVRFAFSLLTIKSCEVEEARFDVELYGKDEASREPIAIDLFPSRVVISSPEKRKTTTKIGADLKFLDAGLSGEYISEFEHENYTPEIISYGVQTKHFRWKFRKTERDLLEGDKVVFATLGKPANIQVAAKFKVSAVVRTTALKKLSLDSRDDEVAKAKYVLF